MGTVFRTFSLGPTVRFCPERTIALPSACPATPSAHAALHAALPYLFAAPHTALRAVPKASAAPRVTRAATARFRYPVRAAPSTFPASRAARLHCPVRCSPTLPRTLPPKP
ncbi:unnamed protein product [Closterium sp. NIES-53]